MGIIQHNAILATTWNQEEVGRIKEYIKYLNPKFKQLFLIGESIINGYTTIVMIPDGSKEGWVESKVGDALRREFITQLELGLHEDNSNSWDYAEVSYGELGQEIVGREKGKE